MYFMRKLFLQVSFVCEYTCCTEGIGITKKQFLPNKFTSPKNQTDLIYTKKAIPC